MNNELIQKTRNAFAYVQQLYEDVALLLADLGRHLHAEPERFVMAHPKGYGVVSRGSLGLDLDLVRFWPMRKFSLFFVPEGHTTREKGKKTSTPINEPILYIRILLDDYQTTFADGKPLQEPTVLYGVLTKTKFKKQYTKLEQLLIHLEYNDEKVFAHIPSLSFDDSRVSLRGTFHSIPLFSLTDAKAVSEYLVTPALDLYRKLSKDAVALTD